MANKFVEWCSPVRLPCAGAVRNEVILCLKDSAILANPLNPIGDLVCAFADATICQYYSLTSCPAYWHYTFQYDEAILADPLVPIVTGDIDGVFCRSCETDWIECEIGNNSGGTPCLADTSTIHLSLTEGGCIQGDVNISADAGNIISAHADGIFAEASGGGGNDWHILGNSDIVDGTNFLGTTNNVPVTIRSNNNPVLKLYIDPSCEASNILANPAPYCDNSIDVDDLGFGGNAILSGGGLTLNANLMLTDTFDTPCEQCLITGGYGNTIEGSFGSNISGGYDSYIFEGDGSGIGSGQTNVLGADDSYHGSPTVYGYSHQDYIGGGNLNRIWNSICCFIGTGFDNAIWSTLSPSVRESGICAGAENEIGNSNLSFIGAGSLNLITNAANTTHWYNAIVSGLQNSITDSRASFIGSGLQNSITDSTGCFIGGGGTTAFSNPANSILTSFHSSIVGGANNVINQDYKNSNGTYAVGLSFIGGGLSHFIQANPSWSNPAWHEDGFNAIGGGLENTILSSSYSGIFCGTNLLEENWYSLIGGGLDNSITSGDHTSHIESFACGIFSGWNNFIRQGYASLILGGISNYIYEDVTFNTNDYSVAGSVICGGRINRMEKVARPNGIDFYSYGYGGNFIGCGDALFIRGSPQSFIGSGQGCRINYPTDFKSVVQDVNGWVGIDAIVNGTFPAIAAYKTATDVTSPKALGLNFIGNGYLHGISNGGACCIAGGQLNLIDIPVVDVPVTSFEIVGDYVQVLYDAILGGVGNWIEQSERCTIGGGGVNTIIGREDSSSILGGYCNLIESTGATRIPNYLEFWLDSQDQTYDPTNDYGVGNTILGGQANKILNGRCSSILGGAFLGIGLNTIGVQNPATRDFSTINGDPRQVRQAFTPNRFTSPPQVVLTAFSDLYYVGDYDLWIGNTDNTARKLKLFSPNTDTDFSSALYSSFQSQAQTGSIEYVLPNGQASDYSAGQTLKIQSVVGNVITLEWA